MGLSRKSMEARVPVTRAESVFEWIVGVLEFGGAEVNIGQQRYDRIAFKASTLRKNKAQVLKALSKRSES